MLEEVLEEKFKNIDTKDKVQDERLNNHSGRLDKLEQYRERSDEKIENLCKQIESLVSTIKWAMGTLIVALIGFALWYIQSLPR